MDYSKLTFEDDKLGRKQFAINMMNIVDQWNETKHENESLVFSIDASWGAGKSSFLHMWKNMLLSEEYKDKNYAVAFYNAWENDDSENAFIPLLYALKGIDAQSHKEALKDKASAFLKTCGIALLKDGIKKLIGTEISQIASNLLDTGGEGLEKALNEKSESFFTEYDGYVKMKQQFKESLKDLIPDEGKLIIFVDELDRCRPTFAVETLEIVKHFFDIENIVFVFAIDLEQLSHSIATMYGSGMDSAGYLRRFFDVNMNMPFPDIDEFVGVRFPALFSNSACQHLLFENIKIIVLELKLSLRDMIKVLNIFLIFVSYYKKHLTDFEEMSSHYNDTEMIGKIKINREMKKNNPNDPNEWIEGVFSWEIYFYFIALKYKYIDIYRTIISDRITTKENLKQLDTVKFIPAKYYSFSETIRNIIHLIETPRFPQKDHVRYSLFDTNWEKDSVQYHIEKTIEMFT